VSVVADLRGRERDVNRFEISADQHGNDVEVRGEFKEKMSSWFHGFNNFDARFVVLVPHEYSVELRTSGGNVEVIALKGRVHGGTSGGDVTAQEVEGEVTMETSGGSIHAEKVTGPVKMKTSGGDVRAVSMTGDVDLRTSGGNVWVEGVDGKVEAHTSGGNVHVKVNGANKGIHAETCGGRAGSFDQRRRGDVRHAGHRVGKDQGRQDPRNAQRWRTVDLCPYFRRRRPRAAFVEKNCTFTPPSFTKRTRSPSRV
jgi:hypothetical protein